MIVLEERRVEYAQDEDKQMVLKMLIGQAEE
jgi:hypothetical protein